MDHNIHAISVFNKRAQSYQERFMDVSIYADTFNVFFHHLEENATVLELACGPGNITRHLLENRPDLNILATDMAPNMITLAKVNAPKATFQLLDCRAISALNNTFNGIMAGFVLPYLSREKAAQLIADASVLLNEGGVLYLSTMEDDYTKSGIQTSSHGDKVYMYFHQAEHLTEVLHNNGLEIIDISRKKYPGTGDSMVTDLIIITQKPLANN